jgi:hypothetical protein
MNLHQLRDTQYAWTREVSQAILRLENQRRREQHQPTISSETYVEMPTGPKASLQLMNLHTWSIRYCVSIEALLEILQRIYQNVYEYKDNGTPGLHVPLALLTGPSARKRLEMELKRMYPNGENFQTASTPAMSFPEIHSDTLTGFLHQYNQLMLERQSRPKTVLKRPYRKVARSI